MSAGKNNTMTTTTRKNGFPSEGKPWRPAPEDRGAQKQQATAWGLGLLLVGTCWLLDLGAVDRWQLPKAAWLRAGVPLLLGLALLRGLRGSLRRTDWAVAAYLAAAGLATATSIHPVASFHGNYLMYIWGLWTLLSLAGLYWLASRLPAEESETALFTAACIAGLGCLAAGFWLGGSTSTQGTTINYAGLLALLVPVLLAASWSAPTTAWRLAWLAVLAAASWQLLGTLSRGAWLGAGAGAVVLTLLCLPRPASWNKRQAGLWGAALAAVATGAVLLAPEEVRDRLAVLLDPGETSASARLGLWGMALDILRAHPLGTGLDTFGMVSPRFETPAFLDGTGGLLIATYAHNELLQVGATMGLPGLAAYLALWGLWVAAALKTVRAAQGARRVRLAGMLGGATALWVHSQFNFPSLAPLALQWAFLGCLCQNTGGSPHPDRTPGAAPVAAVCACLLIAAVSAWSMGRDWLADRAAQASRLALAGSRTDAAAAHAERALALNPRGANYAMHLSAALRQRALATRGTDGSRRDFARARDAARDYVGRHPYAADGWHNLAMALMWSALDVGREAGGDYIEEALAAERRAAELAPMRAAFPTALGEILHYAQRKPEAIEAWVKAADLDPGQPKANRWLARYVEREVFIAAPPDLVVEGAAPGETLDLREAGKALLKVANLRQESLRMELAPIRPRESLYQPPEGYEYAPLGAGVEPEVRAFELGPDEVRVLSFRLALPRGRRWQGRKLCYLVRLRCADFDVPVDKIIRVLVTLDKEKAS